jgi:16S rRNA (guanine527-N7)-methyltransferase
VENNSEFIVNQWRVGNWFSDLSPDVLNRFKIYYDELVKFNKTLNLVSPKTIPVADALHFSDSILAARVIMKANPTLGEIYDLGSGNGFPGLILAVLYPSLKVQLIEMDQKKCEFLKHIITVLKLSNVTIINKKIEELKEGSIPVAICRGLSSISKVLLLMRTKVAKGGVVFHLKGEQWGMEVSEIPIQLCSAWSPSLMGEYRLPVGEIKFAVIKTDRIN